MLKFIKFKLLGMDTDSDQSLIDGTTSIYNYNVRFTTIEDNLTSAVITNERGTKLIGDIAITGTPIGYAVADLYLVIFYVYNTTSYISIYTNTNDVISHYYTYQGNLNFSELNPIECLVAWEREALIKIFWIDGRNPLRFLTIPTDFTSNIQEVQANYFDVVKDIDFESDLQNSISVTRESLGGTFPAGVIQYAFTYYTKYGSESNIFKMTPLYYLSNDRGGTPQDRSVSCAFSITIDKVDTKGNWDFLRIYSILRTSLNGEAVCKRVVDISIKDFSESITYIDNGEYGETIDSTRLLYLGGEKIIPKTIAQKDNTLFLGNYSIVRAEIPNSIKDILRKAVNSDNFFKLTYAKEENSDVTYARKVISTILNSEGKLQTYLYTPQLYENLDLITTFKCGETYRIGVQLQDTTGRWSEPIFLFDATNGVFPETTNASIITDTSSTSKAPALDTENSVSTDTTNTIAAKWDNVKVEETNLLIGVGDTLTLEDTSTQSSTTETSKTTTSSKASKALYLGILPFGHLRLNLNNIKASEDSDTSLLSYFKNLGYIRIRPVIVLPNEGQREVLFQGVANPTIRKGESLSNFDYRIPSWFFRPIKSDNAPNSTDYYLGSSQYLGVFPEYRNGEVITYYDYTRGNNNTLAEFQYKTSDLFYIDWGVITVDSPDIRFNEQISLVDMDDVKARIVGYVDIQGNAASYNIEIEGTTEPAEKYKANALMSAVPLGNKTTVTSSYLSGSITSGNRGAILLNAPLWLDGISDRGELGYDLYIAQWYVFPWHRSGSLNNCSSTNMNNIEGAAKPSVLKKKIIANARFGYNTSYDIAKKDLSITDTKIFLQTSDALLTRFTDGSLYRNNIDIILPASGLTAFKAFGLMQSTTTTDGDKIMTVTPYYGKLIGDSPSFNKDTDPVEANTANLLGCFFNFSTTTTNAKFLYYDLLHDSVGNGNSYHVSSDPIPMLFKTGSNCILKLNSSLDYNQLKNSDNSKFIYEISNGRWLPIVEVYREVSNKFGGTSDDAILQNAWLVAGNPVLLTDDSLNIFWDRGDTYFLRYDCLKTMPYSDSSVNNIIEILSFFCETRINIDGRYDTNRGLQDNTNVSSTNFNLLNDIYSLKDNYFEYYIADYDLTQINSYPNLIIWSNTKVAGDTVDAWTNITLLNSLDLDGSKGTVNAIKNFNGLLYTFLDSGIAMLGYNQNAMVNSQDGVPIEIANSGKVTGSIYISSNQGCINKWTITDIGEGLTFVDSLNRTFNLFNGKAILDLGEKANFRAWIKANCGSLDSWNPVWKNINPNTLTVLHDKQAGELLLVNKDNAVAYSLGLLKFTSFYSYEACPWFINSRETPILLQHLDSRYWGMWKPRAGEYNKFFNSIKPYTIEFIMNDASLFDVYKMFSTLEIRDTVLASQEDTYETSPNKISIQDDFSFDTIQTYNSYLDSGKLKLSFLRNKPSNLKAKFRTWRIQIPRNKNKGVGRTSDRMKDHYLTVKLSHDNQTTKGVKIHDIVASYYT